MADHEDHELAWIDLDGRLRRHPLRGEEVRIGRDPGRDLVLSLQDVSRAHCRLRRADDGWRVVDEGSLAGTFVNDGLVRGERRLEPGDVITLGLDAARFEFRSAGEGRPPLFAEDMPVPPRTTASLCTDALPVVLRAFASSLLLQDVLDIVLDGVLHVLRFDSGEVLLEQARRLVPQAARPTRAQRDRAALALARRALTTGVTVTDEQKRMVAFPLRTFEGSRVSREQVTGMRASIGAVVASGREPASDDALPFAQALCDLAAVHVANVRLYERATHDALTGLYNRGWLDRELPAMLARARRNGRPLALLTLDIDRFKTINDTHLHSSGDEVLRVIARRIAQSLAGRGLACRQGGEEFAVIVSGASIEEAGAIAEDIRAAIAAEPVLLATETGGTSIDVTVSIGVAVADPDASIHAAQLAETADVRLRRSKERGRNRVTWE